ncbi:hypothetical protein BAUCODRAFT_70092 [Baudoinia panamericana UAMH 10762]|uniref:Uncharacterized protein n=1 Tax=Baudoinia panamericana (strain UAMH 10762) TaxID=717646 RepID=M2NCE0_BAUPA|nr:uncharacterized protein BAUCODRAFT_70092 [Baudoinia panamericana UAMH 10762]EMC96849.1 hypothetical protein BAUCODRAFT_70092 [Baudoinia panamericana UAMH 10762]
MAGKTRNRLSTSPVKAFRYEDASNGELPTLVGSIKAPGLPAIKSTLKEPRETSPVSPTAIDGSTSNGSLRSSNSKIASLRAAFERNASPNRKRFSVSTHGGNDKRPDHSVKVSSERNSKISSEQNGKVTPEHNAEHEKEIARLREELQQEKELRRVWEERCALLEQYEAKCDMLEQEVEMMQERMIMQANGMLKEDHSPASRRMSVDVSGGVAKRYSDEVVLLQRQLADLKQTIAMSTRMEGQVTDSVFAQEMSVLHHELQNWIVNNFRRARTDIGTEQLCAKLDHCAEKAKLRHLRPMFETFTPSAKLAIYQATAVCLLMEIFDNVSLYGLPENLPWRRPLREAVDAIENVLTPMAHNRLRATTLDVIRQSEDMASYTAPAVKIMAERICGTLTELTDIEQTEARLYGLMNIVKRAIELQHMFRVQRARFQFDLPSPGEDFHHQVMENIAVDVEAPPGIEPIIRCATFPSVIKVGDEYGDNMHFTNVIIKAKILCC